MSRSLGNDVPEYFSLNYNSAESRILPDSVIISTSKILNAAFSLNEVFPNSELAREKKLGANQNSQRAKFLNRKIIGIFLPRKDQIVRFA
jgi:hypothetical protein